MGTVCEFLFLPSTMWHSVRGMAPGCCVLRGCCALVCAPPPSWPITTFEKQKSKLTEVVPSQPPPKQVASEQQSADLNVVPGA